MTKKRILIGLGGAILAAAISFGPTVVGADSDQHPPKAAVDKMKKGVENPTADGGGVIVDPSKASGAVLILRDPETGLVVRDPVTGLPEVLRDANGKPKEVQPHDVPAEQRLAQGRADERQKRAGQGDPQAQKELREEAEKTKEAVKKHAPNQNGPGVPLPPGRS